jgi:hypothetical protein
MSTNKKQSFWIMYAKVVTVCVFIFSIGIILLPLIWRDFFNLIIFGERVFPASFSDDAIQYIRLIFGITGAVMAAWSMVLYIIISGPLNSGEIWAWRAFAGSVVLWYLLDTSYSLFTGFSENALFNTLFFLAYVPAIMKTRPKST